MTRTTIAISAIPLKLWKQDRSPKIKDVNGDGKISSADYIKIKNHIMETNKLTDIEKEYADANKDGKVSSADYIAIKNHIMEVSKIIQ